MPHTQILSQYWQKFIRKVTRYKISAAVSQGKEVFTWEDQWHIKSFFETDYLRHSSLNRYSSSKQKPCPGKLLGAGSHEKTSPLLTDSAWAPVFYTNVASTLLNECVTTKIITFSKVGTPNMFVYRKQCFKNCQILQFHLQNGYGRFQVMGNLPNQKQLLPKRLIHSEVTLTGKRYETPNEDKILFDCSLSKEFNNVKEPGCRKKKLKATRRHLVRSVHMILKSLKTRWTRFGCVDCLQNESIGKSQPPTYSSRDEEDIPHSGAMISRERRMVKGMEHLHQHMDLKELHIEIARDFKTFLNNLVPSAHNYSSKLSTASWFLCLHSYAENQTKCCSINVDKSQTREKVFFVGLVALAWEGNYLLPKPLS